jgi:hypothetical protein
MMVSDLKNIISKVTGNQYTDEQLAEELKADGTTPMSILDSLGIDYVIETIGDRHVIKIVNGEATGEKLEFTYREV